MTAGENATPDPPTESTTGALRAIGSVRNTCAGIFRAGSKGWVRVRRPAALANAELKSQPGRFNESSLQITNGSEAMFGATTWSAWFEGLAMDANTVIRLGAVGNIV